MADALTVAALLLSAVTLVSVLFLAMTTRRKSTPSEPDNSGLERTIGEVKASVQGLHAAVTQLLPTMGEIKHAADQTSLDMTKVKEFADLMRGSSQKRGLMGVIAVRQYLEKLPREMWAPQVSLPGSEGRVDYVLRINNSGNKLLLPIDSKFSIPESLENFELEANERALIRSKEVVKYIVPGVTTDFAVMVLPDSVLLALTSETRGVIEDSKVVPCSPDGIIIFCTLAMRAQQAVAITQNVERLRGYLLGVDTNLEKVSDDIASMLKSLNGASKHGKETLRDLGDVREKLANISTHLSEGNGIGLATEQQEAQAPALVNPLEDEPVVES